MFFSFFKSEEIPILSPGQYVAAVYENQWWLGMVLEFGEEHDDYKICLLHAAGLSPTFHWSQFEYECYVKRRQVLLTKVPLKASSHDRLNSLPKKAESKIQSLFHNKLTKKV